MIELAKIKDPAEFMNYLGAQAAPELSHYGSTLQPYQNIYYLLADGERIGFLDLYYAYGREIARIGLIYVESLHRQAFAHAEFFSVLEKTARKLGAKILQHKTMGPVEPMREAGWEVAGALYYLQKTLAPHP